MRENVPQSNFKIHNAQVHWTQSDYMDYMNTSYLNYLMSLIKKFLSILTYLFNWVEFQERLTLLKTAMQQHQFWDRSTCSSQIELKNIDAHFTHKNCIAFNNLHWVQETLTLSFSVNIGIHTVISLKSKNHLSKKFYQNSMICKRTLILRLRVS